MSEESTVVFLHIQKTGGTSLAGMLAPHFAAERNLLAGPHGELKRIPTADLAGYDFVHGHFDWSDMQAIAPPRSVISLMREPVARALSLYWFWRSFTWSRAGESGDFEVKYANSVSVDEFFAGAPLNIRANYENAVARQLVGSDFWRPFVGFTIPDREVISICRRHIDEMAFCGTTEQFAATATGISECLGLPSLEIRRENTLAQRVRHDDYKTVEPTPPSPQLVALLTGLTALDAELYRYVRRSLRLRKARLMHALRRLRPRHFGRKAFGSTSSNPGVSWTHWRNRRA